MRGQYASAGTGVFHATAKGFGFITPDTEDGGTEDLHGQATACTT